MTGIGAAPEVEDRAGTAEILELCEGVEASTPEEATRRHRRRIEPEPERLTHVAEIRRVHRNRVVFSRGGRRASLHWRRERRIVQHTSVIHPAFPAPRGVGRLS